MDHYIELFEQGKVEKPIWNIASFLKPSSRSRMGREGAVQRYRSVFSSCDNAVRTSPKIKTSLNSTFAALKGTRNVETGPNSYRSQSSLIEANPNWAGNEAHYKKRKILFDCFKPVLLGHRESKHGLGSSTERDSFTGLENSEGASTLNS